MRHGLLAPLLALAVCGCVHANAAVQPDRVSLVTGGTNALADEAETQPSMRVTITPALAPAPRVHVEIELRGPATADRSLRRWSLPGPVAGAGVIEPSVHDADGEIGSMVERADAGLVLTLERDPGLPLTLDYWIDPIAAELGGVARVELDDAHFFATGEALILLPDHALDRRQTLAVHVVANALGCSDPTSEPSVDPADTCTGSEPTGMPRLRAASSFAAAAKVELDGWPFELRRAAFVAGPLEWATFDSIAGEDRWLGVGPTRFDHRWSAAELAGVRSFVDGMIGLPTVEPMLTILVGSSRGPSEAAWTAELRGRGLTITASHDAIWDAAARMSVTQALVSRWLGARVQIVDASKRRALWFDSGVTRFVARELLWELGLLGDEDYAAELDWIEAELASSPLRGRTLTELGALIDAEDPEDPRTWATAADARAQLLARGGMYMAFLDAELRRARPADGGSYTMGVTEALRLLVAEAVGNGRRELSVDDLVHRAALRVSVSGRVSTGDNGSGDSSAPAPPEAAFMAAYESIVVRGQRPALGSEAFGPCFAPRKHSYRRFELGFIDSSRPSDEQPRFDALDPNGPAARAGLRPDDQLLWLDYVPGDVEQPVTLEVVRGDTSETLSYRPAGPVRRAVRWQRLPNVPPEACVR